jgi:hypothetical protein
MATEEREGKEKWKPFPRPSREYPQLTPEMMEEIKKRQEKRLKEKKGDEPYGQADRRTNVVSRSMSH